MLETKMSKKELRNFAITLSIALGLIGGILFWEKERYAFIPWGIGLTLLFFGFIRPGKLNQIYKVWMAFALLLGFITSHIILAIMYYLVFTPIGLLMRILGKHTLHKTFNKDSESYWIKRETKDLTKERYEKMF